MILLKDDKVRLANGETGVVLDLWGSARLFIKFKRDEDGASVPMPASYVVEIFSRPKKFGGGWKE